MRKPFVVTTLLALGFSSIAAGAVPLQTKAAADVPYNVLDTNQKVRVIVEVDGDPAILYAQKLGKQYDELPTATQEQLQDKINDEQVEVKEEIKDSNIDISYENSFTTVFNGFSGEVDAGYLAELQNLEGVKNVHIVHEYEQPKEQPEMITSKALVEAQKTWTQTGYKGEGMIIGIIDTGVDPSHKDMVLSAGTKTTLSQAKINEVKTAKNLPGKFFTNKVPYGYNYMDKNDEILHLVPGASMHGMHVAGTAGANGDENNGGIKGVAPEAQILALKVFGNDPGYASTFSDIYVKAIDDAIQLGADVLNLSLGSTASFVAPTDPEQMAINNAVNNGIMMSISAGNSAMFGNGAGNPLATNPDIGVVGSPGLSYESIQVASIENSHIQLDAMKVTATPAGGTAGTPYTLGWKNQSSPNPIAVFGTQKLEVVNVGDGSAAQYEGKSVKGKLVMVGRTSTGPNYTQIQQMAESKEAAGVIVKPLEAHGDYVSMALTAPKIPLLSLSIADGAILAAKLTAGEKIEVEFTGAKTSAVNSAAGKMASSTSWGVTPNLDFKPEITAPGNQIFSTLQNNQYGLMSGTSMAAPHVAGGSALVLERVKKDFPTLTGLQKVRLAKNILMNTAEPVVDTTTGTEKAFFSPRRQGAGLMQLHDATTTQVVVTEKNTGEGKVALKEIGDKFEMTFVAKNYGTTKQTYTVDANVLTDRVANGKLTLQDRFLTGAVVTIDQPSIEIPAGGSKEVKVSVDLTAVKAELATQLPNGAFIEGWVTLTNTEGDVNDKQTLSVPYVGYYGDWNTPPVVDAMNFETGSYYSSSGIVDLAKNAYLGKNLANNKFEAEKIAFSPNKDGVQDAIVPRISFLRNAKEVQYTITDKDKKALRKLNMEYFVRKNYYDGARGPLNYTRAGNVWDGLVNNAQVADGQYYLEIASTIDFAGKTAQKKYVPILVDTKKPTVNATYDFASGKLTINTADVTGGSGVASYSIAVNGTSVTGATTLLPTVTEYTFAAASKPVVGSNITVTATDYAGNSESYTVYGVGDNTIPYVTLTSPGNVSFWKTNNVTVAGTVSDESQLKNVKVNGVPVTLTYNATTKVHDFSTTLKYDTDGIKEVNITGEDAAGNAIAYRRQVGVDTTAPTISHDPVAAVVAADAANPTVKFTIGDNYDDLAFYVNGNMEYNADFNYPVAMRSKTAEVTKTLELKTGKNEFKLELVDIAGNVTTKTFSVYKLAVGEAAPVTTISTLSVTPGQYVSTTRPAVISATATEAITWNAKVVSPSGVETALPSTTGTAYEKTFTPAQFAENGAYKVVVAGTDALNRTVVAKEQTFQVYNFSTLVKSVELLNANGLSVTSLTTGTGKIKANIQNLGPDAQDTLLIIQVLDTNKRVVQKSFLTVDDMIAGSIGLGSEFQVNSLAKGTYTVDVYVWSDWTSMSPISEAFKNKFTFTIE